MTVKKTRIYQKFFGHFATIRDCQKDAGEFIAGRQVARRQRRSSTQRNRRTISRARAQQYATRQRAEHRRQRHEQEAQRQTEAAHEMRRQRRLLRANRASNVALIDNVHEMDETSISYQHLGGIYPYCRSLILHFYVVSCNSNGTRTTQITRRCGKAIPG